VTEIINGIWPLAMIIAFHVGVWFTSDAIIEFTPRKERS
jgi:hypothetical protein